MCDVGVRVVLPGGGHGTVFGHVTVDGVVSAIVSPDSSPASSVLIGDLVVRRLRGSPPKPVMVVPGGAVHPLSNRNRTRRR